MFRFFSSNRGTLIKSLQNRTLKQIISDKISEQGPISFAEYMEICLFDKDFGYYNKGKIFGKEGDFITSPEISQLFGESLAVWCTLVYNAMNKPDRWHIVEVGPGRGTLASDILRTLKSLKIHSGLSLHLVDLSPHLQELQKRAIVTAAGGSLQHEKYKGLDRYFDKDFSAYWYSTLPQMTQLYLQDYKDQPVIVIGHEIFDALPVHIFEFSSKLGWVEKLVDLNAFNQFELVLSEKPNSNVKNVLNPEKLFKSGTIHSYKDGDTIEISPASHKLTQDICTLIQAGKSCSLLIDYGDNRAFSDSVRGIKQHQKLQIENWMQMPGEVDLSAYVDFAAIKSAASVFKDVKCSQLLPQGLFLEAMGIGQRAELLVHKNPAKKERLMKEYERLASPDEMGEIYKVLFIGNNKLGEVFPFNEDFGFEKNKL